MEVILLIVAGVVLYYLYNSFKEYFKNPYTRAEEVDYRKEYNPSDNPYTPLSAKEKIQKTEYGVLAGILHNIDSSDGEICALEKDMIEGLLDDMAQELIDFYTFDEARSALQEIAAGDERSLDDLAGEFADLSKGEYKKLLKVVEFLFALAYADSVLSEQEREKIIDVAAIFELNNDDFNKIYDDFESMYANADLDMSKERALEILDLSENYTQEELESAHKQKFKDNKQNILSSKNFNKTFRDDTFLKLRDIDKAHSVLQENLS